MWSSKVRWGSDLTPRLLTVDDSGMFLPEKAMQLHAFVTPSTQHTLNNELKLFSSNVFRVHFLNGC